MLANNFMKPKALGISEAEVAALIAVLGMLERGELNYQPYVHPGVPNGFNMSGYWHEHHCGTTGCIAGWASFLSKGCAFADFVGGETSLLHRPQSLCDLFLNVKDEITPSQAATALRNYLTMGEPRWSEALAAD